MASTVECPLCSKKFPEDKIAAHAGTCGLASSPRPKRKASEDSSLDSPVLNQKKVAPLFFTKKVKMDIQQQSLQGENENTSRTESLGNQANKQKSGKNDQENEFKKEALAINQGQITPKPITSAIPLAERLRPRCMTEYQGQKAALNPQLQILLTSPNLIDVLMKCIITSRGRSCGK